MTSLNADPIVVARVQVASSLPVFLFTLPAGALADIIDARRFLVAAQLATIAVIAVFAVLVSFSASGQVVKIINLEGRPTDVAVNAQGYLFVSSAEGGFIRVYKPDAGDYVGSLKDQKGEDGFNSIKGMDLASDGTLLLAENEQVAQIKILSLEPIEAK